MASNFKVSARRKGRKLNLKLIGDFDGTSAHELLNLMNKNCDNVDKVFIHTSGLRHIYPFGIDTFRHNLDIFNHKSIHLVFTGENAAQIAPERRKLI